MFLGIECSRPQAGSSRLSSAALGGRSVPALLASLSGGLPGGEDISPAAAPGLSAEPGLFLRGRPIFQSRDISVPP